MVTGFLGPNGAGKSTTMRVDPRAGAADAGRHERPRAAVPALDEPVQRVGALLETFDAHPGRSGRNHLRVLAVAGGIPRSRVDEVLDLVELTEAGRRRVKGYSLGMRQRLGLAAALLGDPEVLVLDEPANGLDPQGIRWLRDFLRSLAGEGRTILISSHVLAEVAQTVDEVVIIHRGKLVQQAAMADVEAMAAGRRSSARRRRSARRAAGGRGSRRARLGDGRLAVTRPPERVGEIAAANGVVLHELIGRARDARGGLSRAHRRPRGAWRMTRLFAAELLKLSTLRGIWGFVLVDAALAALVTAGNIGGVSEEARLEPEFQFRIILDWRFRPAVLSCSWG